MLRRDDVEGKFLAGIKAELLDPKVTKEMVRRIRTEARKLSKKDIGVGARIKDLDRQVKDLAETICEVGRSDILTAKLRALEVERTQLSKRRDKSQIGNFVAGATNQWRTTVENLEYLGKVAKPHEMAEARAALRQLVGEITVV